MPRCEETGFRRSAQRRRRSAAYSFSANELPPSTIATSSSDIPARWPSRELNELRGGGLPGRERQRQEHRGEDQEDDADTRRVTGEIHDRDDEEQHARKGVTQCLSRHDSTVQALPHVLGAIPAQDSF